MDPFLPRTSALPPQPTPFVGRWDELSHLAELLADPACRLLTLVGPGGIGKTRLALELAATLAGSFPHGVHFVDLQPLTSPDLIWRAISDAADLRFSIGSDTKASLLAYLHDKTALLLLDNFEHLLSDTTALQELLASAPQAKLLITSRERLNLRQEWVFEVAGLAYPAGDVGDNIHDYSAIHLFFQAARRRDPRLVLADEAASIVRICALVDGMPLAIELAASWVHVLTCAEIARALQEGLELLETTARDVPARHRNIRHVLERSWHMLTDSQQRVMAALSVFSGGADREAARHVAGASLEELSTLVDKSWLRHGHHGRYTVHELLCQFAGEQLAATGAAESVVDAHCAYYADFVLRRVDDLKGRRQTDSVREMDVEFDNVRAAWMRAADRLDGALITQMLEGISIFCDIRNRQQEASSLYQYAEQRFAHSESVADRRTRARLVARINHDAATLEQRLQMALHVAREHDDSFEIAWCLRRLGIAAYERRDFETARTLLLQGLGYYRQAGDRYALAGALFDIVVQRPQSQAWDDYLVYAEESLRLSRDLGDRVGAAWSLFPAAILKAREGKFADAERLWRERITIGLEVGALELVGLTHAHLSQQIYFIQGDFEQARLAADDARKIGEHLGNVTILAWVKLSRSLLASMREDYAVGLSLSQEAVAGSTLTTVAEFAGLSTAIAACGLRDFETAARVFPAALACRWDLFRVVGVVCCLPIAAILLAEGGQDVHAVELLALAFTHPVSASGWMQQWPLLGRLRARLEETLGAGAYAAAWERGTRLDAEEIHAELQALFPETGAAPAPRPSGSAKAPLTKREIEVLQLTSVGLSNSDIAARLFLSPGTVKWYLSEIYSKLGVRSRVEAIARARALNLLNRTKPTA